METVKNAPYYNIETLITKQGIVFTSFAKSGQFGKAIYSDLVAPLLNDDLLVEGWIHGDENLDSDCSRRSKVYNVQDVKIQDYKIDFSTYLDHSKWQVSLSKDWICVGDMNRQKDQIIRGGGTLCQQSQEMSKVYRNLVKSYEFCK